MLSRILLRLVLALPQGAVSRAWGWLARVRRPRIFVRLLQRLFVWKTGIDLKESTGSLRSFESLEELFVRPLRPGARPVDTTPGVWVAPVDGRIGQWGHVEAGVLLQVKGKSYRLEELLDDPSSAGRYEGGLYVTIYLAPRDYHRIHAPVDGVVRHARWVPGRLMPVFPAAVASVDQLFARNERVVTYIETGEAGVAAVVKVGATLVGRIRLRYAPALRTNRRGVGPRDLRIDPPYPVAKGEELGAFELGSTVILVFEPGRADFERRKGDHVHMGERMGRLHRTSPVAGA